MKSTVTTRRCARYCLLPQRYLVVIMLHFGTVIAYILRLAHPTVMTYITKPENVTRSNKSDSYEYCNFTITDKKDTHLNPEELLDWNNKIKLDITSAFFYGYLIGNFPGGYIADKYGGKIIFGLSVLFPGFMMMIIPVVIKQTQNPYLVMALRFFTGLVQGGVFPASTTLISVWTPFRERGIMSAIVFLATQMGTIYNNLFTRTIMENSWSYVFYIYGMIAVVWWFFWMLLCFSDFNSNPYIGNKELKYLRKELSNQVVYKKKSFPWKEMFSSVPLWALVFAQMGHTWVWHSIVKDLPKYMKNIMKFNVHSTNLVASLPYGIMAILTFTMGIFSDFLINKNFVTRDATRKISTTLGAMGPGIFVLTATFSGCNRTASIYLFCIALGLMSFYYSGTRVVALDLAPNYSGCVMGIANGMGAIPGVVQGHISAAVTKNSLLSEWRTLFLISLLVLTVTNMFFVISGTSAEQPWNNWESKDRKRFEEVDIEKIRSF